MSSHREAPEISKDPVADNADVYAFVSPDKPDTVTIISNFVPLQGPAGGPNFYEFGDDVLYSIYIDNDGDAQPEIEYQFQFNRRSVTTTRSSTTSARSTRWTDPKGLERAPVLLRDADRRRPEPADARPAGASRTARASRASRPAEPTSAARPRLGTRPDARNGARNEPALPALQHRPGLDTELRGAPRPPGRPASPGRRPGLRRTAERPVLRRPRGRFRPRATCGRSRALLLGGVLGSGDARRRCNEGAEHPFDRDPDPDRDADERRPVPSLTSDPKALLGIWSAASRRKMRMFDDHQGIVESGPWFQVSRLGNPLFNEVVVPIAQKDDLEPRQSCGRLRISVARPVPRALEQDRERPLHIGVHEARGLQQAAQRPGGDPAHRHPGPERQHGAGPRRSTPTCSG